jgi:HSP20 family molecular chaperone IbpA
MVLIGETGVDENSVEVTWTRTFGKFMERLIRRKAGATASTSGIEVGDYQRTFTLSEDVDREKD